MALFLKISHGVRAGGATAVFATTDAETETFVQLPGGLPVRCAVVHSVSLGSINLVLARVSCGTWT